jgi:hypothetical protein
VIFLLATAALAQDPACPEGYVCLSEADYAAVYGKIEEMAAIEEGQPTITFTDTLIIITDEEGRVFTNGTGTIQNQLHGTVKWGHMTADIVMEPQVKVSKKEPPKYGFHFRPKAIASYLVLQTDLDEPLKAVDAGVDLEFAYAYRWNVSGYVGLRSFGADVGMDIFPNSGVAIGAHWTWPSGLDIFAFSPSAGWYFAF